jgi:hypothetical protein
MLLRNRLAYLLALAKFSIHRSRRRLRWECEADSEPTPLNDSSFEL